MYTHFTKIKLSWAYGWFALKNWLALQFQDFCLKILIFKMAFKRDILGFMEWYKNLELSVLWWPPTRFDYLWFLFWISMLLLIIEHQVISLIFVWNMDILLLARPLVQYQNEKGPTTTVTVALVGSFTFFVSVHNKNPEMWF